MEVILNPIAQFVAQPYFGVFAMVFILIIPFFLKQKQSASHIQVIVTTAGMFGTFLGIVAGIYLLDLRVDYINASIQSLIGGLATAFLTSLGGLAASLAIQINPRGFPYNLPDQPEASADVDPMDAMLTEIKTLNKNIAGEEDSSLTTQIIKMRSDNNDNYKELKKSFDEFAESMVNSNIDALAEAIEKVMGEFNTTVNEKLGQTFDDFKQAVEQLNRWQADYKSQIDSQTENMKSVQVSLDTVAESMQHSRQSLEEILVIKQKFDELLKELNAQLQGSVDFASAMKDLRTDLEDSGKAIREEMKEITYGAANEMEKTMNKTLADFGSSLASISGKMAEDFERIQRMLQDTSSR